MKPAWPPSRRLISSNRACMRDNSRSKSADGPFRKTKDQLNMVLVGMPSSCFMGCFRPWSVVCVVGNGLSRTTHREVYATWHPKDCKPQTPHRKKVLLKSSYRFLRLPVAIVPADRWVIIPADRWNPVHGLANSAAQNTDVL